MEADAGSADADGSETEAAGTGHHLSCGSNHGEDNMMMEVDACFTGGTAETSGHSSHSSNHLADDEMEPDLRLTASSAPRKYKKRKQRLTTKKGVYRNKVSSRQIPLAQKLKPNEPSPSDESDGERSDKIEAETDVSNQEEQIEDKSESNTQRMSIATEVVALPQINRPRLEAETDVSNQEEQIEDKSESNTQRMSIATEVVALPEINSPRFSIGSTETHGMAPTTQWSALFSDPESDGSVDDSCMSANASCSDYSDDRDGEEVASQENSLFEELFKENDYSLNDSCDALDEDYDDCQDISEDTDDKAKEVVHLFSNFDDLSSATNCLAEKVIELLRNTAWTVDCTDTSCRLFLVNNQANVIVERSIYWSSTRRQIEIYINNQPVRDNSFLWTERFPTDYNNITSVANYITMVAFLLESVNICKGVQKFEEFWEEEVKSKDGFIESDIYQGSKCYRTATCSLGIISSGSCSICNKTLEKFRKRDWKRKKMPGADLSKITNKSMTNEELLKKTEEQSKLIKQERRKIQRLRQKIRQLVNRDTVTIDQHLSKDFTKILRENAEKMSPIQKLFWQEQLKALSRQANPRSMRWNPMVIKIALKLQEISPASLDYLRESGFISLPCKRTLYDFSHFADPKEGVQNAILDLLMEKFKKQEENEKEQGTNREKLVCNLLFDEMSIKEDLVINKHGEIVGYVHLNKIEEACKKIEDEVFEREKKSGVAKKILVYMLQGINRNLHEVVGIFSTINLTAAQLYCRTWDVIYNLERRSIPVIALICDAASINKNFFKMHVSLDKEAKYVYVTKNVASGENRPLFFIIDPPHLLKSVRNCLSNSFAHSNSRKMWKNNEDLTWRPIVKLQEKDSGNKFKAHKLTRSHVQLTAFSRMRVSLAAQVLSMSVGEALEKLKHDENFKDIISSELITFLKLCNRFFDCLNGSEDLQGLRHKLNDDLLPYTTVNDPRFEFLEKTVQPFFDNWLNDVKQREGKFTKEDRNRMFISKESYESINITIHGFCGAVKYCLQELNVKKVDARSFNQDKLEQEFGSFRMSEGAQNHPTLHRVIQRSMTRHVSKAAALPPKKGNTEVFKRTLAVDEEPLKRKKRREEPEL